MRIDWSSVVFWISENPSLRARETRSDANPSEEPLLLPYYWSPAVRKYNGGRNVAALTKTYRVGNSRCPTFGATSGCCFSCSCACTCAFCTFGLVAGSGRLCAFALKFSGRYSEKLGSYTTAPSVTSSKAKISTRRETTIFISCSAKLNPMQPRAPVAKGMNAFLWRFLTSGVPQRSGLNVYGSYLELRGCVSNKVQRGVG